MTNREKEIIKTIASSLKELQETSTKEGLVRFLDYIIITQSKLRHTDEFMEKLYFIRYYYNIGRQFSYIEDII